MSGLSGAAVGMSHREHNTQAGGTVNAGLIESRTQEGRHRFYRFRTPLRGRRHRFYWVAPFLSMVHVTDKHVTDMKRS